ncbi:hypothetical protein BDR26DRAFT_866318, partial [Obelidium mucronatum]
RTSGSKTKSTAVTTSTRNPAGCAVNHRHPDPSSKKSTASSKAVSNKIGQALRARFGSDIFSTNEKKKTKKESDTIKIGFDDDVDLMAVAESGGDLMNDSSDDGGSDNNNPQKKKSATTAAKKVVNSAKAVVIVNNANTGRRDPTMGGAREWRTFMTSDVGKMQDNANDRELMDLLQTSKLIEDFNASELFGKDRRKYLENKLHELGAKKSTQPQNALPGPPQNDQSRRKANATTTHESQGIGNVS